MPVKRKLNKKRTKVPRNVKINKKPSSQKKKTTSRKRGRSGRVRKSQMVGGTFSCDKEWEYPDIIKAEAKGRNFNFFIRIRNLIFNCLNEKPNLTLTILQKELKSTITVITNTQELIRKKEKNDDEDIKALLEKLDNLTKAYKDIIKQIENKKLAVANLNESYNTTEGVIDAIFKLIYKSYFNNEKFAKSYYNDNHHSLSVSNFSHKERWVDIANKIDDKKENQDYVDIMFSNNSGLRCYHFV